MDMEELRHQKETALETQAAAAGIHAAAHRLVVVCVFAGSATRLGCYRVPDLQSDEKLMLHRSRV